MRSSFFARALCVLCITFSVPGALEALEDVVHFVEEGQTVHSECDDCEEGEHGCSPFFHTCHCCGQAQLLPPVLASFVSTPPVIASALIIDSYGRALPEHRTPPFRPPSV